MDTIFALSSGAPPAAIGVIRLSGPGAFRAVHALTGALPPPRVAALRELRDPQDAELLDRGLVIVFPGPTSATGEDVAELHVHGGRAVVAAIEQVLSRQPGLRRAEPGEFTRRALLAGRIDLTEAEGLGDLLTAETEAQRRMALLVAEGGVRARVSGWTARAVALAADLEAAIDFSDEDDVPDLALDVVRQGIAALAVDIDAALAEPPVERLRDGIRVVIAGPPNSGKSTLLNALVGREAAIVTPIAGTTRDVIEAPVVRAGTSYLMSDTAGLRDMPTDEAEAIGIRRARATADAADIVLWLGEDDPPAIIVETIWLQARADLPGRDTPMAGREMMVSARNGTGIDVLWRSIESRAGKLLPQLDRAALNHRQRELLGAGGLALHAAAQLDDSLLVAEELRIARRAFDAISGQADTEAVLDSVFARFCIGK